MQSTTIGLDIAKNVFQVHGIDAAEKVVVRKQLRRRQVLEFFKALPACLVGMEAARVLLGAFTVQLKDQISLQLGTLGFSAIMRCAATGP